MPETTVDLVSASPGDDGATLPASTPATLAAGLPVAQFRQSPYWIRYLTHFLRARCGLEDRGVVEVAGAVMHYVSFNTVAHGMMLEPPFTDLRAGDFQPGGRLADAPGPGAPPQPSS